MLTIVLIGLTGRQERALVQMLMWDPIRCWEEEEAKDTDKSEWGGPSAEGAIVRKISQEERLRSTLARRVF